MISIHESIVFAVFVYSPNYLIKQLQQYRNVYELYKNVKSSV